MSEETKNTAQEEETTDTPVTEETVENEPEVVENGEAETEEIPVEDGDEEASQDDKKDSKSKTSFFGKKKKEKDKFEQQIEELTDRLKRNMAEFDNFRKRTEKEKSSMYIIGAKFVELLLGLEYDCVGLVEFVDALFFLGVGGGVGCGTPRLAAMSTRWA